MILKSIRLENIRSYTGQKIAFPEGSVLLSGDIGSGKSTILYAVEFALFGIMRGELAGSSLLRNGEKKGSVELELNVGNKDITIKRTLKRSNDGVKQSHGHIIHDGIKTELTPVELKTRILGMLGYPRSLVTRSKSFIYRYTVYTPQEQMKHILFDDRESRLDTLRKVFGIDKYKRVRENSIVFVHELKIEAKRFEGIADGLQLKRKEIEEYGHEIADLRARMKEEEPKVHALRSKRQAKEKELLAYEEKIRALEDKRKKLEVNRAKASEKRDAIERLSSDIGKTRKEIEEY